MIGGEANCRIRIERALGVAIVVIRSPAMLHERCAASSAMAWHFV
jgi:hypothetical protein